MRIDRKIINDRLHREGQRALQFLLDGVHRLLKKPLRFGFLRAGAKIKPIPPPDIPPSIQNPQKSAANFLLRE